MKWPSRSASAARNSARISSSVIGENRLRMACQPDRAGPLDHQARVVGPYELRGGFEGSAHAAGHVGAALLSGRFPGLDQLHDVAYLPKPISNASGHSGGDAERFVDTDEIVIEHV